jgi:L-fuconolactonase
MLSAVDAHLHLWTLGEPDYAWLQDAPEQLRWTVSVEAAQRATMSAGVGQVVLVQAADSLSDTQHMRTAAQQWPTVAGIVGWAPLEVPARARAVIDEYGADPGIVGLRHQLHNETDPWWLLRPAVMESLGHGARAGLAFDVLVSDSSHLESAMQVARALPELTVVIDHLGAPPLDGEDAWRQWADRIGRIAESDNTAVKLSGLPAALDDDRRDRLTRAVDHVLTCFGASRTMAGSDWPVSTLVSDYAGTWHRLLELVEALSPDEQAEVQGAAARRAYRLRG